MKIRFSYWLTKINAIKKSASVRHWPHSQILEEPTVELQRKSVSLRVFTILVAWNTYGLEVDKYNTSRPLEQTGNWIDFLVQRFKFSKVI